MYISRLLIYSALAFTMTMPSYASNDEQDKAEASTTNPGKRPADDDNSPARPDRPDEQPKKHQAEVPDMAKVIEAAEKGNVRAKVYLANAYWVGREVQINRIKALKLLQEAGKLGYGAAKKSMSKAIELLHKWADQGHAEAQYTLGYAYDHGVGTKENEKIGLTWYQKAAEQGYAEAQYRVGIAYIEGYGIKTDDVIAVTWFQKAAEKGHAKAQYELGFAYWWGLPLKVDRKTAVTWIQKSAEQGYAKAQALLGEAYISGSGIERNKEMAITWYQKAAAQGNQHAQADLGEIYWDEGVNANPALAVEWFQKAAANNFQSKAPFYLSYAYFDGIGVAKDPGKAVEWLLKAEKVDRGFAPGDTYVPFYFQPKATMSSDSFRLKVRQLIDIINPMTAFCEFSAFRNSKEVCSTVSTIEADYALDTFKDLYAPLHQFGDRLAQILSSLYKSPTGLMVSCIEAEEWFKDDCMNHSTASLLIYEDTITFGEENVRTLQQFTAYLKTMKQEFYLARQGLDVLIGSLYPPIASLRACQRAALSGDENAKIRFKQEKEEYDEILSINKDEIDRLKNYKAQLDVVEQGLTDLLPSTIGSRNKEFIESEEFSFLKP